MKVLATNSVPHPHTSTTVAEELDKVISEFNLQDKAWFVCHDNAANMNAGGEISMIDYHIGCFAHLLHLAVTESIQEVPDVSLVVNRVHDFVAKFKTSGTLRSVFDQQRQFLQAQGLNSKMEFQLDNVTRWNSIHKMLSSFCSLHQIAKVCCEISPSFNSAFQSTPNLSSVQDIVRILEPVSKMSIMWQETTQPILSEIYPVLFSLQSSLPSLPKTPLGNSLAKSICSNLVVRFSTSDTVFLTDMSVHVLASAIDPRPFKRLDFLTKQQRKSVTLRLKKIFDEFKPSYKEAKPKSTSLLDSFMGWDAASSTSSHSFDEEYKRFLALSPEQGLLKKSLARSVHTAIHSNGGNETQKPSQVWLNLPTESSPWNLPVQQARESFLHARLSLKKRDCL